jgi:hypothetical protein
MSKISCKCYKCGTIFISTTHIYKTFEKQLYRAGWIDHQIGEKIVRVCPDCQKLVNK